MPYKVEELEQKIEQAERNDDLDALEDLEKCFVVKKTQPPAPFVPPIGFAKGAVQANTTESDRALPFANSLSRAIRKVKYRRKLRSGYDGPIIVAEGDSWFEYPILLDDVLDHLMKDFAVLSLAGAGDLLDGMIGQDEFADAIEAEKADFFLLSAGGNDMLHDGRLADFLNEYVDGMTPEQVFNPVAFAPFVNEVVTTYRDVAQRLAADFPDLTILFHGYDYVLPRDKGKWLGGPLAGAGVPEDAWPAVMRVVIDRFNEGLKSLESLFPGRLFHVDCRGSVGDELADWHDELHPKNAGYGRAADCFAERIRAVTSARAMTEFAATRSTFAAALTPRVAPDSPSTPEAAGLIMNLRAALPREGLPTSAAEAVISRAADPFRRPAHFDPKSTPPAPPPTPAALAAWRARFGEEDRIAFRHYQELWSRRNEPEAPQLVEARREMLPANDAFSLERIIGGNDVFQLNYLSRGERAARAVGRVNAITPYGTSLGYGTGFLVGPGVLMTNHHVLDKSALTLKSFVTFDYEYDVDDTLKQTEHFALTGELFFTSKELDFTLVSVAPVGKRGRRIEEFGRLLLIPESGKAIKAEYVSIIQHANSLPKQIALRDSQILGRKEQFVYYTTDTNPGSSGSPVVNDEWLPVALHHRAVPNLDKPGEYACNRGIRVSAILDLLEDARRDATAAELLRRLRPEATERPRRGPQVELPGDGDDNAERFVEPKHEGFSRERPGYDENFLGTRVPLPKLRTPSVAAKRTDRDSVVLTYEHFSIVMHKERRLALFTASNVDAAEAKKRPEPGRDYSRKGLGELGRNDQERWFADPRLSAKHQLPDRFFTNDRKSFDKGHLVRREDVTWGESYEQIVRANGDTFHVTNCSPQVGKFNRSNLGGLWGQLEDLVLRQARAEKYCVFAGPVLDPSDRPFSGQDDDGRVNVRIPAKYWKVVVALNGSRLESFAFVLEQDLSDVPFEFTVGETWRSRLVRLDELEVLVRHFTFPDEIHQADQAGADNDDLVRAGLANEWA